MFKYKENAKMSVYDAACLQRMSYNEQFGTAPKQNITESSFFEISPLDLWF